MDYSVVIPAHNAALFIRQAIESVLKQSTPPSEIVVVDDGSTDKTAEILRGMGVRTLSLPSARGPSAARNLGAASTATAMIAFLDADDEWKPNHAELMLRALTESDAVFCGSAAELFGDQEGFCTASLPAHHPVDIRDVLLLDNPLIQSAVFVRRDALVASGGYNEEMRLSEDYDLWHRIALQGKYVYIDSPTVRRRMHRGQAMNRFPAKMIQAAWVVRREAALRRLHGAGAEERLHVEQLLTTAARHDIRSAIYNGSAEGLSLIRSELIATDFAIRPSVSISAASGAGRRIERVLQDVTCLVRAVSWRFGRRR